MPRDWDQIAREWEVGKKNPDALMAGSLYHGHTFLRLTYLRGYENFIMDMADDHPKLPALLDMVGQFNLRVVQHFMSMGPAMMTYAEDLGMQFGPMLSPGHFRKYIKPIYDKIMAPARQANVPDLYAQ